jgi:FkbH-like protein
VSESVLTRVLGDIKLVVWDLDDTFWRGTISEGAVELFPRRAQLVKALTEAGVPNSICSNNDLAVVRSQLEHLAMWDWFIFPQVGWGSKVPMLSRTIELAQLRAQQVALIDDNPRVRAEVEGALGVVTATPQQVDEIDPAALPVSSTGRRRLQHYRVLEARAAARQTEAAQSEIEFLRSWMCVWPSWNRRALRGGSSSLRSGPTSCTTPDTIASPLERCLRWWPTMSVRPWRSR